MTSTYDARGRRVGATVVEILPNLISQIKTMSSKDGYDSVQLAYGSKKHLPKPQVGHLKKAGLDQAIRWLREIRVTSDEVKMRNADKNLKIDIDSMKPGEEIKLNQVFSVGDIVKVTGISKGRGFSGGVRRWGFAGGPKTHGQSDRHRAPGSIGSGTTPGRVYKGKKMAGHMGNVQVSAMNLEVVALDRKNNLLTIKGAVPGFAGAMVKITKAGVVKGYTPPPEEKPEEEDVAAVEETPAEEPKEEETTNADQA